MSVSPLSLSLSKLPLSLILTLSLCSFRGGRMSRRGCGVGVGVSVGVGVLPAYDLFSWWRVKRLDVE
jgi:hypothetical protein